MPAHPAVLDSNTSPSLSTPSSPSPSQCSPTPRWPKCTPPENVLATPQLGLTGRGWKMKANGQRGQEVRVMASREGRLETRTRAVREGGNLCLLSTLAFLWEPGWPLLVGAGNLDGLHIREDCVIKKELGWTRSSDVSLPRKGLFCIILT